jgi:hypothetical protein
MSMFHSTVLSIFVVVGAPAFTQSFAFEAAPIASVVLGDERGSASAGVLRNGKMSFHYIENSIEDNGKTKQAVNRVMAQEQHV